MTSECWWHILRHLLVQDESLVVVELNSIVAADMPRLDFLETNLELLHQYRSAPKPRLCPYVSMPPVGAARSSTSPKMDICLGVDYIQYTISIGASPVASVEWGMCIHQPGLAFMSIGEHDAAAEELLTACRG